MTAPSDEDVRLALEYADRYRKLGFQPLPSRLRRKAPMLDTFAEYWSSPVPESTYDPASWRTSNLQLMAGAWPWRLCVVDCDGPEAPEVWVQMCEHFGGHDPTWVARTGSGGWHFYFTTPAWLDELPSKVLWSVWDTWAGTNRAKPGTAPQGNWLKHREVRLLGDRSLIVAPPSLHVDTGVRYEFAHGHSPTEIVRPAVAPSWLIRMPAIVTPGTTETFAPPVIASPKAPRSLSGAFFRREEVIAAIPSKIDVARRWGLRIASQRPNKNGWWNCHAIDRPDATPSASFHDVDGVYWENRDGRKLSLFDLAVALNAYPTWTEARDGLAAEFCRP